MTTSADPFTQACRLAAPLRFEVRHGDGPAAEAAFDKPFVLIGRENRADVVLRDPDVGSRHLYFQVLDGHVFGVHLSDRTGTRSGGRAWEAGWVRPGDEFAVGRATVRFLGPGGPADDPPAVGDPLTADRADRPSFSFEPLSSRSGTPRRFPFGQDLVLVGRADPAGFLVRHPDVSRGHAAVVRTAEGLWVVDLLSRTGVTVNGAAAPAVPVRDGDVVSFGRVGVRVAVPADRPPEPPPVTDRLVPAVDRLAPAAAVPSELLEPVLDQVAALQQQTFEQFRELLGAMMQMVGGVLNEQRQFIREELDRMERMVATQPAAATKALAAAPDVTLTPAATAAPPPGERRPAAPRPQNGHPQMDEVQLHAWLNQRLGSLTEQQSAVWDRFVKMLRGDPRR